jgi:hypothetical protein
MKFDPALDRRQSRSTDPLTAVRHQLAFARHHAELDALVLADTAGCMVAGAGAVSECELLAAYAPLREDEWTAQWDGELGPAPHAETQVDAGAADVEVCRLTVDGSELLLCAKGRSSARRAWMDRAAVGCARILASVAMAALCWFGAERSAAAQTRLGDKRQLVISAENLFGWTTQRVGLSPPGGDVSVTSSHVGFLFTGSREQDVGLASPVGTQIGGHYFVMPSLSIGGTIGFDTRGASTTTPVANGTLTQDQADETTFVLLPKVGYTLALNDVIGFWFRGGIGIAHVSSSGVGNGPDLSDTFWLFSLDALFTVTPVQHFGFYVGPETNLSFTGSHTSTARNGVETSFGASYRNFAIGTGLFGYIDL